MSVYFIRNTVTGNVKIGFTNSATVKQRLHGLQTPTDCPLEVLAFLPWAGPKQEYRLHHHFRETLVAREWFSPSDALHFLIDQLKSGRLASLDHLEQPPPKASREPEVLEQLRRVARLMKGSSK